MSRRAAFPPWKEILHEAERYREERRRRQEERERMPGPLGRCSSCDWQGPWPTDQGKRKTVPCPACAARHAAWRAQFGEVVPPWAQHGEPLIRRAHRFESYAAAEAEEARREELAKKRAAERRRCAELREAQQLVERADEITTRHKEPTFNSHAARALGALTKAANLVAAAITEGRFGPEHARFAQTRVTQLIARLQELERLLEQAGRTEARESQ